jgi:CDP-diacylglycerol---glycerol-3-phosphate 3-phosphatidyltransferase
LPGHVNLVPNALARVRSLPLRRVAFFPVTSLTYLKPRLRKALRPVAAHLAKAGVTNQVTLTSLAGSMLVGTLLCFRATHPMLFGLLPIWLLMRMACATLDGTLAIEFGQKSRIGGVLNEVGDLVSDVALLLPFAFVSPFSRASIALLAILTCLSELAGMAGPLLGSDRRLEGPLGKSDRTIALSFLAIAVASLGLLPESAWIVVPTLAVGSLITTWNRLVSAIVEPYEGFCPK